MTERVKKGDRPETEAERKRRLAAIFGEVLPDTTADERDEKSDNRGSDEWLQSQVPPHHG